MTSGQMSAKESREKERRKKLLWLTLLVAGTVGATWVLYRYLNHEDRKKHCKVKRQDITWKALHAEAKALVQKKRLRPSYQHTAMSYLRHMIQSPDFQRDPSQAYREYTRRRGPRTTYIPGYDDALDILPALLDLICV